MQNLAKLLILFFFSIIITIYVFEFGIYYFNKFITEKHQNILNKFDDRTPLEIIKDFRLKEIEIRPAFGIQTLKKISNKIKDQEKKILPLSGFSNMKIIGHNESGNYPILYNDRYGFNNPDYVWDFEVTDIALIGDSFAYASSVNSGQDIASIIRKNYSKSIINLGTSGSGPLSELAIITEYAKHKEPKIVLWLFYEGNDLGNLIRNEKNVILKKYLVNEYTQELIDSQEYIQIILESYFQSMLDKDALLKSNNNKNDLLSFLLKRLKFFSLRNYFLHLNIGQVFGLSTKVSEKSLKLLKKCIEEANIRTSEWGGKMYFVYLPEYNRYKGFRNHEKYGRRKKILDIIKFLKIPIIDIHIEVFNNIEDKLSLFPFRYNGHYNAKGYRLIGETIGERLKEDRIIPLKLNNDLK